MPLWTLSHPNKIVGLRNTYNFPNYIFAYAIAHYYGKVETTQFALNVGAPVGRVEVGARVLGCRVGRRVGLNVGDREGRLEGAAVGTLVGLEVGSGVGRLVEGA